MFRVSGLEIRPSYYCVPTLGKGLEVWGWGFRV